MWGAIFILAGVIAICVCVGILLVAMLNGAKRELEDQDRREMDRLRFKAQNMERVTREDGQVVLVSKYDMYPAVSARTTQTSSTAYGGSAWTPTVIDGGGCSDVGSSSDGGSCS